MVSFSRLSLLRFLIVRSQLLKQASPVVISGLKALSHNNHIFFGDYIDKLSMVPNRIEAGPLASGSRLPVPPLGDVGVF